MSATITPPRMPGSANVTRAWWRRHFRILVWSTTAVVAVGGFTIYHTQMVPPPKPEPAAKPATALPAEYQPPSSRKDIVQASMPVVTPKPMAKEDKPATPVAAAQAPVVPSISVTMFHRMTTQPEYLKPKPTPAAAAAPKPRGDGLPNSGIEYKAELFDGTTAFSVPHPELVLPQWTTFPCVLETGVITGVSGVNPFRCHTTMDVKSSAGVTLMETGTIVGGTYQSIVADGQSRIVAVTANATTPYNVVLPLGGPVADDIGQAGVEGTVNNHWWARIGGALILSLMDVGVQLGTSALQNQNGGTTLNLNTGINGSALQQTASKLLDKTINIPPTIQLKQGSTVMLWVTKWIDCSHVYALEHTR